MQAHYDVIHAHGIYDLRLDPFQMTPQERAQVIFRRAKGPFPDVFQRITDV